MPSDVPFPRNIIDVLALHFGGIHLPAPQSPVEGISLDDQGEPCIFKRPAEPEYPNGSVGIFATNWLPQDWEIGAADTRGIYHVYWHTVHKHTDRDEGSAISAKCVKTLRQMVYRDAALRVALGSLSETVSSVLERTVRWGVLEQRFQDNTLRGEFVFVSATHFWLETEISS